MVGSTQSGSTSSFTPFGAAPTGGVAPQGFDFGQALQQIAGQAAQALPGLILSLLQANPSIGPQLKAQGVAPQSLFNFGLNTPFGGGGISLFDAAPQPGVTPQGFDFGKLLKDVAGQAAQALPGLIFSLLSANPTIGPQLKAQGVSPQSLFNFGINTPFGGGGISLFDAAPQPGVSPQGFDFGKLLKDVGGQALQALPGLLIGLLSSHPTIGPQLRAQGVSPQSLFNIGINTPFGGAGLGLFDAAPQPGVSPQGFDFGKLLKDVGGQALQALPGLLMGLLSAHPTIGPQMRAQGVSPQSLFNIGINTPFGGAGLGLFDSAPQPGVVPQGFDFGQFARQIAQEASKAIPGIIQNLLATQSAGPQQSPTIH